MQPPTSESHVRQVTSSQDLPYGPLPVRGEPITGPSGRPTADQLVDMSWLALGDRPLPEAMANGPDRVRGEAGGPEKPADEPAHMQPATGHAAGEEAVNKDFAASEGDDLGMDGGDDVAEPEAGLSLTSPRPEADDDVHFGVAARALGVSRKTVERMVKRGELERGPSNAAATVSKRALVAKLEARRRDVSHLARATEIERSTSTNEYAAASPQAATSALTELAPILRRCWTSSWRRARAPRSWKASWNDSGREPGKTARAMSCCWPWPPPAGGVGARRARPCYGSTCWASTGTPVRLRADARTRRAISR